MRTNPYSAGSFNFAELQRCNCGREYVYVYEEQSDYCSYYDGDYSCDQHPCGVCPGKDPISGRNRIFMVILVIRMVPAVTQLLPLFQILSKFHLINTRTGLIISYLPGSVIFAVIVDEDVFMEFPAGA